MEFSLEQEQGEFNQAIAYQYRLHMIFMYLDNATIKRDYDNQYRLLRSLYKELYPMMNPQERIIHEEHKRQATEAYTQITDAQNRNKKTIKSRTLNVFDDWEISLRDLTQRKNMLMPQKKDSRLNI